MGCHDTMRCRYNFRLHEVDELRKMAPSDKQFNLFICLFLSEPSLYNYASDNVDVLIKYEMEEGDSGAYSEA